VSGWWPGLKWRVSSLRWRLTVAISGMVLLSTIVCIAAAVLFLRQALTDRATSELRRSVNGVSGYLDNQRSDLLGEAKLIASDPGVVRATLAGNQQSLILRLNPMYADLNTDILDVISARGRVLVRLEDTLKAGDAVGNRASIRAALAGRATIALESDLPNREAAGGYALRAIVPVRQGTRIVGVVAVGRQLDSVFAARIAHALDADVNLIAGGQRTGTTLTDSHGLPMTGLPEPASVVARIAGGKTTVAQVVEDGQTELSGLVPLQNAAGQWVGAVEVVRPLDPLYNVIRGLSLLLLALGALVVAVGTLLALYVGRRLTARLMILEKTASRVAALAGSDEPLGAVQVQAAVRGNDEVASLAGSLGTMMSALDQRMAANAALYAAAQARVRELTGLAEIARLLTAGPSVRETMDQIAERVCALVGCPAVAIWLPEDGDVLSLYGSQGLPDDYEQMSADLHVATAGTGFETTAQIAMRTGQVARQELTDTLPDTASPARRVLNVALRSRGLEMVTAVPLRIQHRIVGALACYLDVKEPLSDSDMGLLTTIADQVAVAVENARLSLHSRDLAALEERQRLARELHDSVSQALFGIALGARTARSMLDRDPQQVAEPLAYVLAQAEAGLTEMRALIFELRPEALETEGLVAVLDKQVAAMRLRHGMTVHASIGPEPTMPFAVKEAIYRIAQEAFHNAVKHAQATDLEVRLAGDDEGIRLEVSDNGRGFDPAGDFPGHLGLRTMRDRAMRLGGRLEVDAAPGAGTRIRLWIPATPARGVASYAG